MRHQLFAFVTVMLLSLSPVSPLTVVAAAQTVQTIENLPVWRVQVEITEAGTPSRPGGGAQIGLRPENLTRLYPAQNTSTGTYRYDLILQKVRKFRDIVWIQIGGRQTGWLTIKELTLLVNGRVVYNIEYPGLGLTLPPNTSHYVMASDLRAHALWQSYAAPSAPQLISGTEIMSRVESIVGDFIDGPALRSGWLPAPLLWRPPTNASAIRVSGKGPQSVRVDLALKYYQGLEYRVDVSFDLEFSCSNGMLRVRARNVDTTGYPSVNEGTSYNRHIFGAYLEVGVPSWIQAALQAIRYTNDAAQPECPPVRVVGNSVYLF